MVIDSILVRPYRKYEGMVLTLSPIVIEVTVFGKADSFSAPHDVQFSALNTTEANEGHPLKALEPNLVTEPGMTIDVRPVQYSKADDSMVVTELGSVTDFSLTQYAKAFSSIVVTELENLTEAKLLHR